MRSIYSRNRIIWSIISIKNIFYFVIKLSTFLLCFKKNLPTCWKENTQEFGGRWWVVRIIHKHSERHGRKSRQSAKGLPQVTSTSGSLTLWLRMMHLSSPYGGIHPEMMTSKDFYYLYEQNKLLSSRLYDVIFIGHFLVCLFCFLFCMSELYLVPSL